MNDYSAIIILAIISTMLGFRCSEISKLLIKQIGIHDKFYPKHYIMPSRLFRKIFKLKKQEIPKWLYYNFFVGFIAFVLFLLNTLIYFIYSYNNLDLFVIQIVVSSILGLCHGIYIAVFVFIYKK